VINSAPSRSTPPTMVAHCNGCGASLHGADGRRPAWCPYCRATAFNDVAVGSERERAVLPFAVERGTAIVTVREWIRKRWLSPERFRRAEVAEVCGIYVPVYLGNATVHADYSVSVRAIDNRKHAVERPWVPMRGRWSGRVEQAWVSASKVLSEADLDGLRPFALDELRRFDARLVAGWEREACGVPRPDAEARLQREIGSEVQCRVASHFVGDQKRVHSIDLQYESWHAALVLLPVWVLSVREGLAGPVVRVLVNGQTGRMHASAPKSWLKQTVLAVGLLLALALIQTLAGML
jgi:hypothetical protein